MGTAMERILAFELKTSYKSDFTCLIANATFLVVDFENRDGLSEFQDRRRACCLSWICPDAP